MRRWQSRVHRRPSGFYLRAGLPRRPWRLGLVTWGLSGPWHSGQGGCPGGGTYPTLEFPAIRKIISTLAVREEVKRHSHHSGQSSRGSIRKSPPAGWQEWQLRSPKKNILSVTDTSGAGNDQTHLVPFEELLTQQQRLGDRHMFELEDVDTRLGISHCCGLQTAAVKSERNANRERSWQWGANLTMTD